MINMADQFLNVEEACELLRIKKSWLYQNHKLAGMPSHYVGRKLIFKQSELVAWVSGQAQTNFPKAL
jgi:excisionase family DNA binding protein